MQPGEWSAVGAWALLFPVGALIIFPIGLLIEHWRNKGKRE